MPLGFYRVNSLARYVAPAGDEQRTAKTLTANGNVQVDTAVSKFSGASMLFSTTAYNDGTTDTLVTNDSDDFVFTGDLTWECWVYIVDNSTSDGMVFLSNRGGFDADNLYIQARLLDNKWQWGNSSMGANVSTATWSFNTWYHVALVRSGSGTDNFTLYIDGTSVGTDTFTGDIGAADSDFISVGGIDTGTDWFGLNGNIDEVRISTNARYTSSFTPSTTPFVNDENTVLLIHGDGTDGSTNFYDDNGDRAPLGVTAFNDAQVDTAQYKIGSASLLTDGTGDRLEIYQENSELAFGTGDFTIEFWLRMPSLPGSGDYDFIYDARSTGSGTQPSIGVTDSDVFFYTTGGFRITSSTALSTNTWHHVALVRSSGTTTLYQDGSSVGTYSDSNNYTSRDNVKLMLNFNDVNGVNGHLDEFRVSDTARYTTSFTPSTSAFENDSNTLVLLHFEGSDTSTDFVDDNGAA